MRVCIVSPYKGLFSITKKKKPLTTLTTETSRLPQGLDRFGFGAVPNSFLPLPGVIGLTGECAKNYVFSASDEIFGELQQTKMEESS